VSEIGQLFAAPSGAPVPQTVQGLHSLGVLKEEGGKAMGSSYRWGREGDRKVEHKLKKGKGTAEFGGKSARDKLGARDARFKRGGEIHGGQNLWKGGLLRNVSLWGGGEANEGGVFWQGKAFEVKSTNEEEKGRKREAPTLWIKRSPNHARGSSGRPIRKNNQEGPTIAPGEKKKKERRNKSETH